MTSHSGMHSIPSHRPANGNVPHVMPATAADVQRLLGDIDPMIVARVLATNANVDEISEALLGVEDEVGFGETPHAPSSSRVAEVRAILDESSVFGDDDMLFDEYDPSGDF